jgi:HD-GYP domain-containing protein (c-di-GMP phosphodiesterase class II)
MYQRLSVNLGNLLLSLSDSLDLADSSIALHQQRTAFISWEMGKAANLADDAIERLFVAGLLHDIGALAPEEKISLHQFESRDTLTHCIRGGILLQTVPWLKSSARIVRFHHQDWNRWQEPIQNPDVLEAQILFLADYLERIIQRNVYILHQHEHISDKITALAGTSIHPDVVDLFRQISRREEFWLDLVSPRLYSLLLHNGPYRRVEIDPSSITAIGELFRNIIDFRSRFTSTHSSGVSQCAGILAQLFGFSDTEADLMRVAGNFHDIGKLAVPNSILNKPDKLTGEEYAVVRQHTYFTYSILNTIGGLQHIAEWAAFHHERLDGSGYPFHHEEGRIGTGARIMAVADIFTAIAEDRPYRKGMGYEDIKNIMRKLADSNSIDRRIVHLVLDNYPDIVNAVKERQVVTRDFYERQFAVTGTDSPAGQSAVRDHGSTTYEGEACSIS